MIDDIDIKDVFFCNGTIAGNIAYGSRNVTAAEIEAAARAAYAHNFILAMPDGYDRYIDERGVGRPQRTNGP